MKYNIKNIDKQEMNGCSWWDVACHVGTFVGGTIHSAGVGLWNSIIHGYGW